uniref:Uncharacterized protein n=1 Tax=Ditylenchus dipsaci TaxID=166011 RepID=A0A915ENZ6_9BILA
MEPHVLNNVSVPLEIARRLTQDKLLDDLNLSYKDTENDLQKSEIYLAKINCSICTFIFCKMCFVTKLSVKYLIQSHNFLISATVLIYQNMVPEKLFLY